MNLFKEMVLSQRRVLYAAALEILLLIVIVFCCIGREAAAAQLQVDYLYVEANEGDSSGGHAALRFANDTFHFQHEPSGITRIQRLASKLFDHIYAGLGNRAIRRSSIDVSAETFNLLLDGFNQFLIIQDEQMRILNTLQGDVTLFKFLLDRTSEVDRQAEASALPLKGVGYFLSDDQLSLPVSAELLHSDNDSNHGSHALHDLKSAIRRAYGEDFIELRIARAAETLRNIKLSAARTDLPGLSAEVYPFSSRFASTSYDDAVMSLYALQLLQAEPKLMPGSYWDSSAPFLQLTPEETRSLQSFAVQLEDDLLRLLNSPRSDWGFPFIAGMARLAAIEHSLASGKLVFLDVFSETVSHHRRKSLGGRRYLPDMKREAEESFLLKRKDFFAGSVLGEGDYAALELLANDFMELNRSIESDVQPRSLPEAPIPSRIAWLSSVVPPEVSENELRQELAAAVAAEAEYAKAVSRLYEYDLFRHNCATEIFAFINASLMRHAAGNAVAGKAGELSGPELARNESLQRLGGYVDGALGLNFMPAVSAAEVDASYTVTAKSEQPSYRAARLAEMKRREASLMVFLRESNTITSTIYHRPPNDSPFLFFTDDTVLLRPVFGVGNLLVGIGESFIGLVTMPLDGSKRLYLGAKGILFSIPELFFLNLRKGTMEYVAQIR